MDLYKIIGKAIRTLRREKKLSQLIICNRSGLNLSYYCEIERGNANPSIKKLYSILLALEVTPSQFAEALSAAIDGQTPSDTEDSDKSSA